MKIGVVLITVLILALVIPNQTLGQEDSIASTQDDSRKKNAIHFQIGILDIGLGSNSTMFFVKYSRFVIGMNKPSKLHVLISAGGGGRTFGNCNSCSENYYFLEPSVTFLIGRTSRFFEIETGGMVLLNFPKTIKKGFRTETRKTKLPFIKSGFRFQAHDGGLLFRVGFGVPVGWYFGFGYAF